MKNQTDYLIEKNKIYYFSIFKSLLFEEFIILEYGILGESLEQLEKREVIKFYTKERIIDS